MNQERLMGFLRWNREAIRKLLDDAYAYDQIDGKIEELGCMVNESDVLSSIYGVTIMHSAGRAVANPLEGYQTWESLWRSSYDNFKDGYIHTHPKWGNFASPDDIALLKYWEGLSSTISSSAFIWGVPVLILFTILLKTLETPP